MTDSAMRDEDIFLSHCTFANLTITLASHNDGTVVVYMRPGRSCPGAAL